MVPAILEIQSSPPLRDDTLDRDLPLPTAQRFLEQL